VQSFTPNNLQSDRLTFNIFASLAEFERDIIRERTNAGLTAARARGRVGGRPKGLASCAGLTACAVETLYREGKLSSQQIAGRRRQREAMRDPRTVARATRALAGH
jgi:DNA invertase Pin-like site-specific DNA recombinase